MKKINKWQHCSRDPMFGILLGIQITGLCMADCSTSLPRPFAKVSTLPRLGNFDSNQANLLTSRDLSRVPRSPPASSLPLIQCSMHHFLFLLRTRRKSSSFCSIVTLSAGHAFYIEMFLLFHLHGCACVVSYLLITAYSAIGQKILVFSSQ